MYTTYNGTRVVQDATELPDLRKARSLYADFETTSFDDKKKSTNPWRDCYVAGLGLTVDEEPGAWYVPVNHRHGECLLESVVASWWCDLLDAVTANRGDWTNHNVKYDAHVSANCLGVLPECPLNDTLTWAKLVDSDRLGKGGYGLDALSRAWLHEDIDSYYLSLKPYLANSKDYGRVPVDVMAAYCGQDVMTNRRLAKYIRSAMPDQCHAVWQMETDLTTVLFHVERTGMRVNKRMLQVRELEVWGHLMRLDKELAELVGRSFNPAANEDCFDVICNQYGLPVLAWTEEGEDEDGEPAGNPSFDKHALAQYMAHPFAPHEVIKRIVEYRKRNTHKNFFVRPYQEVSVPCDDGSDQSVMHPTYNQVVRTGRMSCKKPNSQQLDKSAKELVLPPPGCSIVSVDDSQIEFRTIVHYIQDEYALDAYARDPDTDFHDWVSKMVGIKRKPAKTINFLMAFGGGKEKLLRGLESNMDLVGDLKLEVARMLADGEIEESQQKSAFEALARRKAEDTYTTYHETLPSLKRTSRHVAKTCEARGYVYNLAGRRRHLPKNRAHIAFNTLNQSSAADMMKMRMVKLFKYLTSCGLYGIGKVQIMAQVHDELVLTMPTAWADDSRTRIGIVAFMETCPIPGFRVPLRCAIGSSATNWREASESAAVIKYDRLVAVDSGLHEDPLRHLLERTS